MFFFLKVLKSPSPPTTFLNPACWVGHLQGKTWEMDKQLPIYNKLIKFESMERKHGGQIHSRSQVG